MKIFSIYNKTTNFYNRPIYCESSNEALSYVANVLASDADRALLHLRSDLSLYCLGEIDFTNGIITQDGVEKICDLDYIFATIPDDHVPRTEKELRDSINSLRKDFDEFYDNFRN